MDEKSVKIVEELSDYVNGSCKPKEFCNAMSREHRYLQNEFTEVGTWKDIEEFLNVVISEQEKIAEVDG